MGILKTPSKKEKPQKSIRLPSGDNKTKSQQKILLYLKHGADAATS
jgi:hypothetical protein